MFDTEKELVRRFKPYSRNFISKLLPTAKPKRHFVIDEFDSGSGVADLVVGTYRHRISGKCVRSSINLNWVSPLAMMSRNQKFHVDEFVESYGYSKKTVMLQVREYANAGFIKFLGNGVFIVKKEYEPVVETIVAIEAKLRDWKQALRQACRYRRFSDYSLVLLDADNVAPAVKAKEMFVEYGIGLASLDQRGCSILISPARHDRRSGDSFNRINEEALSQFRYL